MVSYVTGLEIESLCARLDRFGAGRVLDDNASILVNYKGGAKGLYWSSQIAVGHDNGLRLRIYGTKGAIEWFQENPNYCPRLLPRPARPGRSRAAATRCRRGPSRCSRIPSGHPEGYFEALRQHLHDLHRRPRQESSRRAARRPTTSTSPSVDDGVRGVRFIEKCVESSRKGAVWVKSWIDQGGAIMARPVTLFTGQWADLPFEEVCKKAERLGLRRPRDRLLGRPHGRPQGRRRPGLRPGAEGDPREARPQVLGPRRPPRRPVRRRRLRRAAGRLRPRRRQGQAREAPRSGPSRR